MGGHRRYTQNDINVITNIKQNGGIRFMLKNVLFQTRPTRIVTGVLTPKVTLKIGNISQVYDINWFDFLFVLDNNRYIERIESEIHISLNDPDYSPELLFCEFPEDIMKYCPVTSDIVHNNSIDSNTISMSYDKSSRAEPQIKVRVPSYTFWCKKIFGRNDGLSQKDGCVMIFVCDFPENNRNLKLCHLFI